MTTIKIFRDEKARDAHIKRTSDRWMKGDIRQGEHTLVLTAALFIKIFSPKRLEMLMALQKDENVTELARRLHRPFEVVYRDLVLFKEFGLVRLRKEQRSVFPSRVGEIRMPIIHA